MDSAEKLPIELQKNYAVLKTLDNKTKKLTQKIDLDSDVVLRAICTGTSSHKKEMEEVTKVERQYAKVHAIMDERVQLAVQTYELVDKHIRHLDADLSRFEMECRESEKQTPGKSRVEPRTTSGWSLSRNSSLKYFRAFLS